MWKFWRKDPTIDAEASERARRAARLSIERARSLADEANAVAGKSAKLRESNGFAEAIYELMFLDHEGR